MPLPGREDHRRHRPILPPVENAHAHPLARSQVDGIPVDIASAETAVRRHPLDARRPGPLIVRFVEVEAACGAVERRAGARPSEQQGREDWEQGGHHGKGLLGRGVAARSPWCSVRARATA